MKKSLTIVGAAAAIVASTVLTQAAPARVTHIKARSLNTNASDATGHSLYQRNDDQLVARVGGESILDGGKVVENVTKGQDLLDTSAGNAVAALSNTIEKPHINADSLDSGVHKSYNNPDSLNGHTSPPPPTTDELYKEYEKNLEKEREEESKLHGLEVPFKASQEQIKKQKEIVSPSSKMKLFGLKIHTLFSSAKAEEIRTARETLESLENKARVLEKGLVGQKNAHRQAFANTGHSLQRWEAVAHEEGRTRLDGSPKI